MLNNSEKNWTTRILTSQSRRAEIFRYCCGCACGLLIKISISGLATALGIPMKFGYLAAHLAVLIESFAFHSLLTFRKRFSGAKELGLDIVKFISVAAAVKILDYLTVVWICTPLRDQYEDASGLKIQILNATVIIGVAVFFFILRYILFRKIFRKPSPERCTGPVRAVFVTHASDREIAANAASGGFCTALLNGMLKRGEIDGALVSVMDWSGDDPPTARSEIVSDRAGLIAAQGSIYFDFPLLSAETMGKLRDFPGKLAVVALPCQAAALRRICENDPILAEKIVLVIGLFCGHATKRDLLLRVLEKKGIKPQEVEKFRFRRGRWRGQTAVRFKNRTERSWPTGFYNLYQNLFVMCAKRCLGCGDHFAEQADICCGDIWRLKYRRAQVKPSMVAIRTARGEGAFDRALQAGDFSAEVQTVLDLFKANSRSAIFHKAVAARKRIFAKYGIDFSIPDGTPAPRWNELLAARIVAPLYADPQRALASSRRWLKFKLYVFKALTSF